MIELVFAALGAAIAAGAAFYFVGRSAERRLAEAAEQSATQRAERIIQGAQQRAEAARVEAVLAGKEEAIRAREKGEAHAKERRDEVAKLERRLEDRESQTEKRLAALDRDQAALQENLQAHKEREAQLGQREDEIAKSLAAARGRLEQVAGLSADEAKAQLVQEMLDEAKSEAAALVRDIREQAKRTAERDATKVLATAIQRMSTEYASGISVAAIALPNDEMKGRIIGREGRNIRAFETATGVDVIIDDTPDTVVVSCFDPVRREVGRLALEQLISDGRIHPGRIEEIVEKVRAQVDKQVVEAGEQAAYEIGVHGLHPELIKLVGQMKYRTSYGQNLYDHSKEVAWLAGIMAAELKLDVQIARRGALLHDVGKMLTHQHEGTHVELGVEVATKYGEDPVVINCIAAHHDDVPHESPISVLVQAADSASGGRPGARREAFESYVKRLTRLEEIANGFNGVEKTFAIQAGREVRIVVSPDTIDDDAASRMSEEIARRIEAELQYPGQIKVVVVRETRSVDFAR